MKIMTLISIALCAVLHSSGQLPLIDKGVQVEGMWCFPVYGDSLRYVYLPYQASLAKDENNSPQFSYMRYILNEAPGGNSVSSMGQADGGAILNFLVLYQTPEKLVESAEKALQKKFKNDSIKIRGPLIFNNGRYSLISSIISGDSTVQKRQILSMGNAPVLENSRVALSFGLTPVTSKILLENFKMSTPDVSLVFDMEFSGLTDDYDAELEIDWSELKKNQSFNAGGTVYFVSADVKLALDECFKSQAIKLKVVGKNESMDALLTTVYDKLINLLFAPVQPEQLPERAQNDLMSSLTQALTGGDGMLSSGNTTGFGAHVGFQLKEMKTTGKSRLFFKGKSTVQRHHYITFNIGNLYKTYGNNKTVFRDVSMDDLAFTKRKIVVGIDGELEKEFDKVLNSVTVILVKNHSDGEITNQQLLINRENKNNAPVLWYGYHEDTAGFLQYKHRCIWQFKGGGSYESGWKTQDASMINLYTPFKRKKINLEGDVNALAQKGIKAFSVQISYSFFNQLKQDRITSNTTKPLTEMGFEITQPNDTTDIDYTITWIKTNGETIQRSGKDKIGIIFIDELP